MSSLAASSVRPREDRVVLAVAWPATESVIPNSGQIAWIVHSSKRCYNNNNNNTSYASLISR